VTITCFREAIADTFTTPLENSVENGEAGHNNENKGNRNMESNQALDPRVAMAAERTLLAWTRTSLAMMGFGFVVAKFGLFLRELAQIDGATIRPGTGFSLWIGGSLVVLGVVVNVVAAASHVLNMRRYLQGKPYTVSVSSFGVVVTLTLALIGLVLTAYLGFWSR
jgi:putative membrane protein